MLKRLDCRLENVVSVIASCVVLHNLCEKFGDNFRDEWADDESTQIGHQSLHSSATSISSTRAAEIRDAIKDYLASQQ